MTRMFKFFTVIVLSICSISYQSFAQQPENASQTNILLADPTIMPYQGTYYLYGTGGDSDFGFLVYTSSDLKNWSGPKGVSNGFAVKEGDVFGDKGFWAPQVFRLNNKFYMAYTANENIAIAVSDNPLGPFTQTVKKPLEAPVKQIDPFIFKDDDGKVYLYHVRLQKGNRIFVAEMQDDLSAIKPETLKECIHASDAWENTEKAEWPVAEGPTVLKHGGLYYLIYSANDFRNPNYAVGYAVSENALGPWKKYVGNPILSRKDIGINGTGHGDFFKDKKGELNYVFHTHHSDTVVSPRKTAVITIRFVKNTTDKTYKIVTDKKSFYPLKASEKSSGLKK